MPHATSRRPFSAERKSRPQGSNGGSHPASALTGDSGSIAAELAALRAEIADLRTEIGTRMPTPPAVADDGIDDVRAVQLEIAQLVKSIAKAKAEIAAIKHPKADDDRLLAASNELDAIVTATEFATHDILEAAESIETEAANLAGLCHDDPDVVAATERIVNHVVKILEASNFQDITGQRITKVVETVRFIEERVLAMINIWGVEAFEDLPLPQRGTGGEEDLLNGPQLENQGVSQADIDALFD